MKNLFPLLLSAVLLSTTVACNKTSSQTNVTSTNNKTAIVDSASSQPNNQKITVPAGTSFDTVLQQEISTGKNQNNDRFVLKIKNSLLKGNPILKDGQIQGHLEDVVKAAKGKKASLHLVFDDVSLKDGSSYPIDATLINTQLETKTKGKFIQNAGIILGGAVAGHFLGDKAKFKHGGLAGGAAAAAFVLSSPGGEVVLKKGTNIKLQLKSAIGTVQ
ncbi:hypothetical protein I8748_17545 [Nostoc sp. CENA67]|uniref:Lipoprotein n=1 Tax=Amazonocrinis nigriterrae CENA67 TaxID=2794033 RepID=A0A8J7L972_9NOST|nr:hypothetical protein [Amazonocrinis nigriterrae]MBH8563965.1 hypothetical protein [Amazonocrinis nigriterrae CENA67]